MTARLDLSTSTNFIVAPHMGNMGIPQVEMKPEVGYLNLK
jgi:hypothetical protein